MWHCLHAGVARRGILLFALLSLLGAGTAGASSWGGHNGVIRLSFTPGGECDPNAATASSMQAGLAPAAGKDAADSLAPGLAPAVLERPVVVHSAAGDSLVVAAWVAGGPRGSLVDLYAVLDDVALVHWNGLQLRALGGIEFALRIEGGPAFIVGQDFPLRAFNVLSEPGHLSAGLFPELPLRDHRATLVHWRIYLPGTPHDMVFRLDPGALRTCGTMEGCPESGSQALWTGSPVSEMAGLIFSAGYTPAVLNWDGEPDLAVVRGRVDWNETGLFTPE
ncbi:MAG: hypothetical protein ACYDIE_02170 [Candidatus Krumholzibacteriia bacterium]